MTDSNPDSSGSTLAALFGWLLVVKVHVHRNVRICYNAEAGCFGGPPGANLVAKPRSGINDSNLPLADEFRYISGMGHLLAYARVSTGDQDVALRT